MEEKFLGCGIK
ncbi:hypothetical protein A2U01_0071162, partial [Trifolium medium]|nr:hypothetical protein [Trifolium medium]